MVTTPLNTLLMDLRSSVTRDTILLLIHFAKNYPFEFSIDSSKFFTVNDSLLKLLNNGKRLISDMAHDGISQIINAMCIPKVMEQLLI